MDMFFALGDPTRRNIIEILATEGRQTATDISKKFQVTPPAISQHLKILKESRLVEMEKQAQKRIYKVNTNSLQELEIWARKMTQRWHEPFKALDVILKIEKAKIEQRKYGPNEK